MPPDMRDRLQIETGEAGYAIRDNVAGEVLIEGTPDWTVACELHEMLMVDLEDDGDEHTRPG